MEITESLNMGWTNYNQPFPKEEYDDVFSLPFQLPPIDLSGIFGFTGFEFGMHETAVDAVHLSSEMCLNDPFYPHFDLPQYQTLFPGVFFCEPGNVYLDEMGTGLQIQPEAQPQVQQQPPPLSFDFQNNSGTLKDEKSAVEKETKKGVKRWREDEEDMKTSKKLTRKMVSQYFYMPITQAARELNVGLTLLKKRCRELGIRRWPHRKLMSLQTLIKNVQEFGKGEGEAQLQESLDILEQEKKLLEEIPDMQLEDKTKKLRQAFFKANYKKRKLMGMIDPSSSSKTAAPTSRFDDVNADEEVDYFLSDCFSSTSSF